MATIVVNPYEEASRLRKAHNLQLLFVAMGESADTIERLDDEGWALAERLTGVHPASDQTKAVVIDLMYQLEGVLS
jgi:hypothetical protein